MEDRTSFTFSRSFYNAALCLYNEFGAEGAADFLFAVCGYALDGTEPENISGVPRAAYILARMEIQRREQKRTTRARQRSDKAATVARQSCDKEGKSEKEERSKEKRGKKPEKRERKNKESVRNNINNNNILFKYTTDFETFWKAYPRKVGKQAAFKAYTRNVDVPVTDLIIVIEREKKTEQWKRDGGQFIPHPATWLNQHRWLDEPTETTDFEHRDKSGDIDLIESYLHRRDANGAV